MATLSILSKCARNKEGLFDGPSQRFPHFLKARAATGDRFTQASKVGISKLRARGAWRWQGSVGVGALAHAEGQHVSRDARVFQLCAWQFHAPQAPVTFVRTKIRKFEFSYRHCLYLFYA